MFSFAKKDVSLEDTMVIKLPKKLKKDMICGVAVQKDNEFIAVSYVCNKDYSLKIFTTDGTQYIMNFKIVSTG